MLRLRNTLFASLVVMAGVSTTPETAKTETLSCGTDETGVVFKVYNVSRNNLAPDADSSWQCCPQGAKTCSWTATDARQTASQPAKQATDTERQTVTSAPKPPHANPRHFVQVAALKDPANVEPTKEHLRRTYDALGNAGVPLFVEQHEINGGMWHVVMADAGTVEAADNLCSRIRNEGGNCFSATRTIFDVDE